MIDFPLEMEAMGQRGALWLRKLQGAIEDFVDDAHGVHLRQF